MAAKKITTSAKYGASELRLPINIENRVQGNKLADTGLYKDFIENGQFCSVDLKTGEISAPVAGKPAYFHHSVVKVYESKLGATEWRCEKGWFVPRIMKLGATSYIAVDTVIGDDAVAEIASFNAMATYLATKANKLYAYPDTATGWLKVVKDIPADLSTVPGALFEVTEVTTMKTGEMGLELITIA
ncbi:MAG: hypothetical protein ACRC1P_11420 [Cellulosilyticaceae bacterium]